MSPHTRNTIMKTYIAYLGTHDQDVASAPVPLSVNTVISCPNIPNSIDGPESITIDFNAKSEGGSVDVTCDVNHASFTESFLIQIAVVMEMSGCLELFIRNNEQEINLKVRTSDGEDSFIVETCGGLTEYIVEINPDDLDLFYRAQESIKQLDEEWGGCASFIIKYTQDPLYCFFVDNNKRQDSGPMVLNTLVTKPLHPVAFLREVGINMFVAGHDEVTINFFPNDAIKLKTVIDDSLLTTTKPTPKEKVSLYCNENGQPLLTQVVEDYDQLTVVNYEKWYGFYILYSNGTVERVGTAAINEILEQGFQYYDHIPHPLFMIALARYLGALLPTTVLEAVAGRWAIEMEELYNDYDFYGVNEE